MSDTFLSTENAGESGQILALGPIARLRGTLRVPGDKSVSHRALLFAAVADGESRVTGLAPGGDVRSTRDALARCGVGIADEAGGAVRVRGRGWTGLDQAGDGVVALDCGNSGTTTRLLLGLLAARRGRFRLHGDHTLSRRPMARVIRPLREMGASIEGGETLPTEIRGAPLKAANLAIPVASAQVKSALILAGLQASGETTVTEPAPSRDHTERMLAAMGAPLVVTGTAVRVTGGCPRLRAVDWAVPGDPSSAAFAVALACARPGSEVVVEDVDLNPRRLGIYRILRAMGADVRWEVAREMPEPVGRIVARGGRLRGVAVDAAEVVDAIDEMPVLAVVASVAEGPTTLTGLAELRVKESDRLATTAGLLRAFGAAVEETPDGLRIAGRARLRGAAVDAHSDHRIAMSAAVAAALAEGPTTLRGAEWVRISYPAFFEDLGRLAGGA